MKNSLKILALALFATSATTPGRAEPGPSTTKSTFTSTAGQSQSTDTTTTTSSITANVELAPGADGASLQSYYSSLWTSIRKFWWVPEELFFKQVKVKMSIGADGKLIAANLAQSSGDPRADNLALIAIKRAAPFEAPPKGLTTPLTLVYTIGFAGRSDRDIMKFNGKTYGKHEDVTLATGTKIGHSDRQLTELDKQFQVKREAALLKMNRLYDAMAREDASGQETNKKAQLMTDYADCLSTIQEQKEARTELTSAVAILDKNQAPPEVLYPSLSRLAQLNYSVGDLTTAESQFKQAIELKEKIGTNAAADAGQKAELKQLMETYAKLLYKQNRTTEADEIYKKIKALGA